MSVHCQRSSQSKFFIAVLSCVLRPYCVNPIYARTFRRLKDIMKIHKAHMRTALERKGNIVYAVKHAGTYLVIYQGQARMEGGGGGGGGGGVGGGQTKIRT